MWIYIPERLPPRVTFPPVAKDLTAMLLFNTTTKSVISAPICPPKPMPPVPMAEGADQDPSSRRATTIPEPALPEKRKPALTTVKMARPFALDKMSAGMILSTPLAAIGSI